MSKSSLWILRIFLFLAIIFSGLEKAYSYLVFNHGHALETNPFARLTIHTTGLLNAHVIACMPAYLWAVDFATDKVYQIDVYGNIQTSWEFTPLDPRGIAYDTTSGHLWIVAENPGYLYEYYTNGTEINNWDPSGSMPKGVAYSSVDT